jgi:hypothetical protein
MSRFLTVVEKKNVGSVALKMVDAPGLIVGILQLQNRAGKFTDKCKRFVKSCMKSVGIWYNLFKYV